HVYDRSIPGPAGPIAVRLYYPQAEGPLPALVYFHGGGFVIGDLDTHDPVARRLCAATGAIVCAVDYRLAPEYPFPAAPNDAAAATEWMLENAATLGADPERVTVIGDSAGGMLALVSAMRLRGHAPPLSGQVLIYPMADYYEPGTASYREFAEGYGLTRESMIWFWRHYLPDPALADHPEVSPLRATDLSGLPPTLVITAEYDVLRDEGEALAERLAAAGVPVTRSRVPGLHHGFIRLFAILDEAQQTIDSIAYWLEAKREAVLAAAAATAEPAPGAADAPA
ncbi:MAG TPA: alpha/beta hydrolase, partial [Vicinamibacterales bacterium]